MVAAYRFTVWMARGLSRWESGGLEALSLAPVMQWDSENMFYCHRSRVTGAAFAEPPRFSQGLGARESLARVWKSVG